MTLNQRVRFCGNNFLTASGVSILTTSSFLTGFPSLNAPNLSRSKVWRPKGNFDVTAANQKLYFNDGSDQTATLVIASYAGGAALAAQMQTQMNAVSSSWEVTYSSTTFSFNIDRSGGTKKLNLQLTTNAVWDTIGFTGSTQLTLGTGTTTANEPRNHTSEYLVFDTLTAQTAGFMSVIGPADMPFPLSSSTTLTLYGNSVNSWASPTYTQVIPITDGGAFRFLDDTNPAFRYWRIEWKDRTNPLGPSPSIAQVYIGDYETLTQRNVGTGLVRQQVDPSFIMTSESGAQYAQLRTKYMVFDQLSVAYMNAADRRNLEQLFYDLGATTPFYIAFDPETLVSADLAEMTRYVYLVPGYKFTNIKADVYSLNFAVREAI